MSTSARRVVRAGFARDVDGDDDQALGQDTSAIVRDGAVHDEGIVREHLPRLVGRVS